MTKEKPPQTAEPFLPKSKSISSLRKASKDCQGCPLYKNATQTVFGEGKAKARVVLIGEQPGDHEDIEGHPFVGPAGALLEKALREAGISRADVYVTNAVKHFKWVPRGKIRLHSKPRASEIHACFPWLEAELQAISPSVILCLGATAAWAVFGRATPVLKNEGKWLSSRFSEKTLITSHPSSILRAPSAAGREEGFKVLVRVLKKIRGEISKGKE